MDFLEILISWVILTNNTLLGDEFANYKIAILYKINMFLFCLKISNPHNLCMYV